MTTTKMNYNSTTNQEIKGKFVQREVIQNINLLMQHLMQSEDKGDWEDEIFNLAGQPDYETAAEYEGWFFDDLVDLWRNEKSDEVYTSAMEVCEGENIEPEYSEPYEFWIVSDWLGEKLKQNGEIVEGLFNMTVWGRCTTGQAILLDHCISKVCEDLEILEGQKSDWSKQK